MAHALLGYDGACRNIHGHSYRLQVTLAGSVLKEPGHPKDGMVIDFKHLKTLVRDNVVKPHDHALVLNERSPIEILTTLQGGYEKVLLKPYQPTAENLLLEFVDLVRLALPEGVTLHSMRLYETATCYVEWGGSEN